MNDDRYQHLKDFLDDDSFVRWVITSHDERRWRQFPNEHPDSAREFERARRLVRDLHQAEAVNAPLLDRRLVWNRISANLGTGGGGGPKNFFNAYPPWQWAVGLALSLVVAWLAWQLKPVGPITYRGLVAGIAANEMMTEKFNRQDKPLVFSLEDHTKVTLQKNSRLSYPVHFAAFQRKAVLTGEARFEIASDSLRPFYVYTSELVTTAYDSHFEVRAFNEERNIAVEVRTGRVSVHRLQNSGLHPSPERGLFVLPNQKAVFDRNSQTVDRRLIEYPMPVIGPAYTAPLRYQEAPASKILRQLETQYGVTILFNDALFDYCKLTISLGNEPLREKIASICRSVGATYREVDGQFVVESVGCRP